MLTDKDILLTTVGLMKSVIEAGIPRERWESDTMDAVRAVNRLSTLWMQSRDEAERKTHEAKP